MRGDHAEFERLLRVVCKDKPEKAKFYRDQWVTRPHGREFLLQCFRDADEDRTAGLLPFPEARERVRRARGFAHDAAAAAWLIGQGRAGKIRVVWTPWCDPSPTAAWQALSLAPWMTGFPDPERHARWEHRLEFSQWRGDHLDRCLREEESRRTRARPVSESDLRVWMRSRIGTALNLGQRAPGQDQIYREACEKFSQRRVVRSLLRRLHAQEIEGLPDANRPRRGNHARIDTA